jgi:hypothetical protein
MTEVNVPAACIDMSSMGFFLDSEDFLSAYKAYAPEYAFSTAKNFLACRSLELVLKAFIAAKGESHQSIRLEYSHSLVKALARAKGQGLLALTSISDADESEIEFANTWYSGKRFEYFQIRNIPDVANGRTPDHQRLAVIASKIQDSIRQFCIEHSRANLSHS